jgi:hypothetical protein
MTSASTLGSDGLKYGIDSFHIWSLVTFIGEIRDSYGKTRDDIAP